MQSLIRARFRPYGYKLIGLRVVRKSGITQIVVQKMGHFLLMIIGSIYTLQK